MKKEIKVYLGADHAGFAAKERIKKQLALQRIDYKDFSPVYIKGDDYPYYAFKIAKKVAEAGDDSARGILVCGTGTGMVIAANKVKGVRAIEAYDNYTAKMSREHNNANILCLRGRKFPLGKIKNIVNIWLNAEFSNAARHKRRIKKIRDYEK